MNARSIFKARFARIAVNRSLSPTCIFPAIYLHVFRASFITRYIRRLIFESVSAQYGEKFRRRRTLAIILDMKAEKHAGFSQTLFNELFIIAPAVQRNGFYI